MKAYPRKWFVNHYFARIRLGKVDRMAESFKSVTPYFDTREEAHANLTLHAQDRLRRAKAELPAAERNLQRVAQLKRPAPEASPISENAQPPVLPDLKES